MKKILLIALAAVVVVGAGLLSVSHYKNYQNKKTHEATVAAQQKADALATERAKNTSLLGKYDALRLECEKGLAAYENLTPLVQKKSPQPVCGTAVVQH